MPDQSAVMISKGFRGRFLRYITNNEELHWVGFVAVRNCTSASSSEQHLRTDCQKLTIAHYSDAFVLASQAVLEKSGGNLGVRGLMHKCPLEGHNTKYKRHSTLSKLTFMRKKICISSAIFHGCGDLLAKRPFL